MAVKIGTLRWTLAWAAITGVLVLLVGLSPAVLAQSQSSDATLSSLTLSDVDFGTFASSTTSYTSSVAKRVTETTVTPTTNHSGASYVIKLDGVQDADGTVSLSVGSNAIAIEVTAQDGQTTRTYRVTVTRAANTPATGAPTISGTAQVHKTLTANTSDIADADAISEDSFNYQWFANDGSRAAGPGDRLLRTSTDPTYVVQSRDEDDTIWVQVWFIDDGSTTEFLDSGTTGAVTAAASPKVPNAPEMLMVDPLAGGYLALLWKMSLYPYGDGGSVITGYKVQWKKAAGSWDTEADVSEQLISVGNLSGAWVIHGWSISGLDEGVAYTVRVLAINAVGAGPSSTEHTATPPADETSNSPATGAPTISGTAQVGQVLTTDTSGISDDTDGLTNPTYSYQWLADDTEIDGATSSTYTVQSADNGKVIKVQVTFTDDADNEETLTSEATEAVVLGGL